jgi:hypothetical protein
VAKLSRKELEKVVAKEAPGYQIAGSGAASDAAGDAAPSADEATPDLEQMQQKYGGDGSSGSASDAAGAKESATKPLNDDDTIVALEPKDPADPWERGSRAKSIVVSNTGKVIGRQG